MSCDRTVINHGVVVGLEGRVQVDIRVDTTLAMFPADDCLLDAALEAEVLILLSLAILFVIGGGTSKIRSNHITVLSRALSYSNY